MMEAGGSPAGGETLDPQGQGRSGVCPCGSGRTLQVCCGPALGGSALPVTAEALMRSRYTAYVLGNETYLLDTWHPGTRPGRLGLDEEDTIWEGLSVAHCRQGSETDAQGEVEFTARYRQAGRLRRLHEVSRFVKEGGRWYYLDGRVHFSAEAAPRPGRNDPCHCGSGKKFKKCCGARNAA